ncbi:MAG TPA: cupredoxin family copper-binding protein [Methanoregula sp.]|jgi:amicyanin|nr:cupredoxin family copper-binding protein [Methanoregula sp.]
MKNSYILTAITVILLLVCGCTQSPTTVQPTATVPVTQQTTQQLTVTTIPALQTTASVSDNTIRIKNFAFDPASITVKAGSTVRWVNQDSVPHRILFADNVDSNVLAAQQSYSRKFDQAGTYDYSCTIHPTMQGTVIVE